MDKIKVERTIDTLSKLIEKIDDRKEGLINKYSSMKETEVIKDLVQIVYQELKTDDAYYTYALEIIRNINPKICPTVEDMKTKINRMYANKNKGSISLEENHKLVDESIVKFTSLFNKIGIDYYVEGAIPSFIKCNIPFYRSYDSVHLMVNENDIQNISKIMELSGYKFQDDRFPNLERFNEIQQTNPPHTIQAQDPNNKFSIGFSTFRRENDNSITIREYKHRLVNGTVAVDLVERKNDKIASKLKYDDNYIDYKGTSFKTGTVEDFYLSKEHSEKQEDITDIQKIRPFVDMNKLEELKKHPTNDTLTNNIEDLAFAFQR